MIRTLLVVSLLILVACKNEDDCNYQINWNLQKVGTLSKGSFAGAVDFIFLSPTSILVANFPQNGSDSAPLQIYSKSGDKWVLDVQASSQLPQTFHARQMTLEDVDGDNIQEVVIADHGLDGPPWPGGYPIILRQKNGQWTYDEKSKSLGSDFTFNVAAINMPDGKKAIYKANVFGKTPIFFSQHKGQWVDITSSLPSELHPGNLCLMTTLPGDFDQDGKQDLFLGGCDQKVALENNVHDRILHLEKDKWTLAPVDSLPPRPGNATWGTVFVKMSDWNSDSKPDILAAIHDFGFHTWKVGVYVNESSTGHFKFNYIEFPLIPEKHTEGYINSFEDFQIPGIGHSILAEYRSVIRSKDKVLPSSFARLIVKSNEKITDATGCVPQELRKNLYRIARVPGNEGKLLYVPYHGDILSLKPEKK